MTDAKQHTTGRVSTTFRWKHSYTHRAPAKPGQIAPATATAGAPRRRLLPFPARNPYKPLWVRVSYRGGPDGEWEMVTRGHRWIAGWGTAMGDVFQWLNGNTDDALDRGGRDR